MNYYPKKITCINCGNQGHTHKFCRYPIISYGIICFRIKEDNSIEYLLIQRKHSIAYVDFVRGKYNIMEKTFLNLLFRSMTREEKKKLRNESFDTIWSDLWIKNNDQNKSFQNEYENAKKKFNEIKEGTIELNIDILVELNMQHTELNWGFPKGRRQKNESDINCAKREFNEETNYSTMDYKLLENMQPITEEFIGSNGVAYKYIYYVGRSINGKHAFINPQNASQMSEIGNINWFDYDETIKILGDNRRRISMLNKLHTTLELKYQK